MDVRWSKYRVFVYGMWLHVYIWSPIWAHIYSLVSGINLIWSPVN